MLQICLIMNKDLTAIIHHLLFLQIFYNNVIFHDFMLVYVIIIKTFLCLNDANTSLGLFLHRFMHKKGNKTHHDKIAAFRYLPYSIPATLPYIWSYSRLF